MRRLGLELPMAWGLLLTVSILVAGDVAAEPAGEVIIDDARAVHVASMTVEFEGLTLSVKQGFVVPLTLDGAPTGAILLGETTAQVTLPQNEDGSGRASELTVEPRFVFIRLAEGAAESLLADAERTRSYQRIEIGSREVIRLVRILDECRSDSYWKANVGEHSGDSFPVPQGEGHIDLLMSESRRWCLEWDASECRLWDYYSSDSEASTLYLRKSPQERQSKDLLKLHVEASALPALNEITLDVNYVIELEEPSSELHIAILPVLRIESVSDSLGNELTYSQQAYEGPLEIAREARDVAIYSEGSPYVSWDIVVQLSGIIPPYNYETQEGVHDMYYITPSEIRFNVLWLYLCEPDSTPGFEFTSSFQLPSGFRPVIVVGTKSQLDYSVANDALVVADTYANSSDITFVISAQPSVILEGSPEIEVVYTLPEEREVARNVAEFTADAAEWLITCLGSEAMPIERVVVLQDYHNRKPWTAWAEGFFTVNQSTFQDSFTEDYLRRGVFHELSHTAFGHALSPRQLDDYWLQESLPVFLKHVRFGDSPRPEDLRSSVLCLSGRYRDGGILPIVRNRGSSSYLGDAIIYMLRHRYGDEAVMSGVQALVRAGELDSDVFLDAICEAVGAPPGEDIEHYLTCSTIPSVNIDWEARALSSGYRLTVFPQARNFGPVSCNMPLACVCDDGSIHELELPVNAAELPAGFFIPTLPIEVYIAGPSEDALVITPDLFYMSLNANMQPAKNKLYFKNDLRGAALHLERIQARNDRAEIIVMLARVYLDMGDRNTAYNLFLTVDPSEVPDYSTAQYESLADNLEGQ